MMTAVPVIFLFGFFLMGEWLFLVIALYTAAIVLNLLKAKLRISGDKLVIPVPSIYFPKTIVHKADIMTMEEILVERLTPSAKTPESLADVCWRDRIVIDGKRVLNGEVYGNLGEMTREICKINPAIQVRFRKNSYGDNWHETSKASLIHLARLVRL